MSRTAAVEYARQNIRVNVIKPGGYQDTNGREPDERLSSTG